MHERHLSRILTGKPTIEGAGVRLQRIFGFSEVPLFDPFLMMDDFSSDNPEDFLPGFPWHPHRGIETVTYLMEGEVEHGDSLGNKGTISGGDAQWMTAGSGIIHQEMPQRGQGRLRGFQLWVNLPAASKLTPPFYQDARAKSLPEICVNDKVCMTVVCGSCGEAKSPVQNRFVDANYYDVTMEKDAQWRADIQESHTLILYVTEGELLCDNSGRKVMPGQLAHLTDGDEVRLQSGEQGCRFLWISGKPVREPVAWRGPIVMNTRAELDEAFEAYYNGTFIQKPSV